MPDDGDTSKSARIADELRRLVQDTGGAEGRPPSTPRTPGVGPIESARSGEPALPPADVAVPSSEGAATVTPDDTSRGHVPLDPSALYFEVLLLPSRIALSATACLLDLPNRMLAAAAGGAPTHPARRTRPASQPAGDGPPPASGDAGSARPTPAHCATRPSLGRDDPRALSSAHNLAHIVRSGGDYRRAAPPGQETLARRRPGARGNHTNSPAALPPRGSAT